MNVSAIPEVVPSTEIAPTGAATPGGAPVLPAGFDFAALFLAALGLSGAPTVPGVESPAEPNGETPASDAPENADDANAVALAAASAALPNAPALLPTPPAGTPANEEGDAHASTVPTAPVAASVPAPILPLPDQSLPAETVADGGEPEGPPAPVAKATPPDAPLTSDTADVTTVTASPEPEAPVAPEAASSDTVELVSVDPQAEHAGANADDVPSEAAAANEVAPADSDAAAEAKPADARKIEVAGAAGARAPEQREEGTDGRARERSSTAATSGEASRADMRTARADGEPAGHEPHDGGRELGRRETVEATRSGGGPDPSAPSPLPQAARVDTTVRHERLPASTLPQDVERIIRLDALRSGGADNGEMRLELTTDELGRVDVRVAVRADAVHASLFASHDHAREALEAHRPSLEAALGRSHLRLEGFNVALGQQGRDSSDLRDQTQGAPSRAVSIAPVSGTRATAEPIRPMMTAGGLSLRA